MPRLIPLAVLSCLVPQILAAELPRIAVDPQFAPVAEALAALYIRHEGGGVTIEVHPPETIANVAADVILGPDTATADALLEQGLAEPDSRITYATGPENGAETGQPRDAVMLNAAKDPQEAREFLAFLLSSEAWDLIVSHGFGAH